MVRDGVKGRIFRSRPRSRLLGGTLSGRRDPRVCLGISRPSKTPLFDVELKKSEVLVTCFQMLRVKNKAT
jgi:hypothetical protein